MSHTNCVLITAFNFLYKKRNLFFFLNYCFEKGLTLHGCHWIDIFGTLLQYIMPTTYTSSSDIWEMKYMLHRPTGCLIFNHCPMSIVEETVVLCPFDKETTSRLDDRSHSFLPLCRCINITQGNLYGNCHQQMGEVCQFTVVNTAYRTAIDF